MRLKILIQLSHFITMLFGVALGFTLTIYFEYILYNSSPIISYLVWPIILIVIIGVLLRTATIYLWRKNNIEDFVDKISHKYNLRT